MSGSVNDCGVVSLAESFRPCPPAFELVDAMLSLHFED